MLANQILLLFPFFVNAQHCDKDQCGDNEEQKNSCVDFNFETFNAESPSIIYGEARGRFGNQFLAYMVFLQLKRQLGVKTYIDEVCRYGWYISSQNK